MSVGVDCHIEQHDDDIAVENIKIVLRKEFILLAVVITATAALQEG